MKELSLNILDIAENSVKAKAGLTEILISEEGLGDEAKLTLTIKDNGCGMSEEIRKTVTDPFYTTRTTRKVGMGLPLLKMEAEMTGGSMEVVSKWEKDFPEEHGTVVTAVFYKNHIDFTPLGDVVESIITLIQGHPDTDFHFSHSLDDKTLCELSTIELRQVLEGVPLNSYEVICWIRGYMREQYDESEAASDISDN